MPVLHLIAGPNGAGKTTFYEYFIAPRHGGLPFVNAQVHLLRELRGLATEEDWTDAARQWSGAQREQLFREGKSFVAETILAHPSRVAMMTQARTLGFDVVLYALAVDDPRTLLARIAGRVREGGAGVAPLKLLDRYERCLDNLRHAIPLADLVFLFDGVDALQGGPRLVASLACGQMRLHTPLRPRWVDKVLGFAER